MTTELDVEVESEIERIKERAYDIQEGLLEAASSLEKDGRTWRSNSEGLSKTTDILNEYEIWYNQTSPLVSEYLPDRHEEFKNRYTRVRKCLEVDLEFLDENNISSVNTLVSVVMHSFNFQHDLVDSISPRIEIEKLKAKKTVSKGIVSEELEKARRLFDDNHTRAAGVICGVSIERHLITMCETSDSDVDFDYMDGIASLAESANKAGVINSDDLRLLDYLGGIRNKCSHANEEDPERAEVDRMINQANDFIYRG